MTNSGLTARLPPDSVRTIDYRIRRMRGEASRGQVQSVLGGVFAHPAEIPVAEESDQSDDHERREKKLSPGDDEPRREEQQSDRRKEGKTCEARTAPCEDSGGGVRTA